MKHPADRPASVPQVICMGEILFDRLADQVAEEVEAVQSWSLYAGGAPANVATALCKLGTRAGFVGCVGNDALGRALIQVLQDNGVEVSAVQIHPTAPTRQVDVLRNVAGDRRFAGFGGGSTYDFADTFLDGSAFPPGYFEGVDLLVTGTLGLATPHTGSALATAIDRAKAAAVEIVVDVNWRSMFWENIPLSAAIVASKSLLSQADWIKLTEEEADLLFQTQSLTAIQQTHPQVKGILLTAGAEGCRYWIQGHEGQVPAFPVATVDTTGAGDSFLAGFLDQWLRHRDRSSPPASTPKSAPAAIPEYTAVDYEQMVIYASAVGALTTLHPGAIEAQPTAAAVQDFLLQAPSVQSTKE